MIEPTLQPLPNGDYRPYSQEDKELGKAFLPNQLLRSKIWGSKKPRSIKQLRQYWALCRYTASQVSDHKNQFSENDVDFEIKIKVAKKNPGMIKRFKNVDGVVYMEPISISFPNMEHLDACKFFKYAYPIMADDELMANEKEE